MTKHICWRQGNSLKCSICGKYPWTIDSKEEEKKWRSCLAQLDKSCPGKVLGYTGDRICPRCKENVKEF